MFIFIFHGQHNREGIIVGKNNQVFHLNEFLFSLYSLFLCHLIKNANMASCLLFNENENPIRIGLSFSPAVFALVP